MPEIHTLITCGKIHFCCWRCCLIIIKLFSWFFFGQVFIFLILLTFIGIHISTFECGFRGLNTDEITSKCIFFIMHKQHEMAGNQCCTRWIPNKTIVLSKRRFRNFVAYSVHMVNFEIRLFAFLFFQLLYFFISDSDK